MIRVFSKKMLKVVFGFVCFFTISGTFDNVSAAENELATEETIEATEHSTSSILDKSVKPSLSRGSQSEFIIDPELFEKNLTDSYLEEFPEYDGEIILEDLESHEVYDSANDLFTKVSESSIGPNSRAIYIGAKDNVAKGMFYYYQPGGRILVGHGSAFLIGPSRLATAAHNYYDKEHGYGWANGADFHFGVKGSPTSGFKLQSIYTITAGIIPTFWRQLSDDVGRGYDYAAFQVKRTSGVAQIPFSLPFSYPTTIVNTTSYGYSANNLFAVSISRGSVAISTAMPQWLDSVFEGTSNLSIQGGMSGGPLVNYAGQAIGINVASYTNKTNKRTLPLYIRLKPNVINFLQLPI